MKHSHKRQGYARAPEKLPPLTPNLFETVEVHSEWEKQIAGLKAAMESQNTRMNGQQARIESQQRFTEQILAELHLQRAAIETMGAPLRPIEQSKSVARRLTPSNGKMEL